MTSLRMFYLMLDDGDSFQLQTRSRGLTEDMATWLGETEICPPLPADQTFFFTFLSLFAILLTPPCPP